MKHSITLPFLLCTMFVLAACQEKGEFFDKSADGMSEIARKKKAAKENPSTETGTGTTKPGTQTGSQPGTQTGSQPGTQTGTQPGTTTTTTTTTPGTQPGTNSGSTPTTSTTTTTTTKPEAPKFRTVTASEDFQQVAQKSPKLDILWVVDNSGSMADEQGYLARNFITFIDSFIKQKVDFKMAITTTDSRELWKGLVVKGSMETLTSKAAKENQQVFLDNFKDKIMVGTKGNGVEHGLAAIENFSDKHGANFLREDAYFIVIVVTDEDDQSPLKVSDYAAEVMKIKRDSKNLKVFAIADSKAKHEVNGTLVKGSSRYNEFARLTNGKVLDIRQDFHKSLKLINESVTELIHNFKLAKVPEAGSVKISVNGKPVAASAFRVSDNVVIFEKGQEPATGSEIKISYSYKEQI